MSEASYLSTARWGKRSKTDVPIAVRPATLADLNYIMEIERASFPVPWSEVAMAQEIEGRDWSHVFVATEDKSIVGFMVYWAVVGEIHLLNLAVHPDRRHRGVGRSMVQYLTDTLERDDMSSAILEVRVSNQTAQKLYRSFGFYSVSVRMNYYTDNDEDAIVMCLRRR